LIMNQLVLGPTEMSLSTFEQPLPDSRREEAASGHYGEGILTKGSWHTYPEMAAAGLWTTSIDLSKWALDIAAAWNGRTSRLLTKSMVTQMLTPQKLPSGLGVLLEGGNETIGFTHGGGNKGFRSELIMFPVEGKGAVMMTNADQGNMLIGEVFTSLAAEYNWPGRVQSERNVAQLKPDQIDTVVGTYSVPGLQPLLSYKISRQSDRLTIYFEDIVLKAEIYPASDYEFFSTNGFTIKFTRDNSGHAVKMNIGGMEAIRQKDN
jgi:CubicO group peptidase (beta-lactamase class C family)